MHVGAAYVVSVSVDKAEYKPGDVVKITVKVQATAGEEPYGGNVDITVRDPDGKTVFHTVKIASSGNVQASFNLPSDAKPGTYTVVAIATEASGQPSGQTTFKVSGKKPKEVPTKGSCVIEIAAERDRVKKGEEIRVRGRLSPPARSLVRIVVERPDGKTNEISTESDEGGRFEASITANEVGRWAFQAMAPPTNEREGCESEKVFVWVKLDFTHLELSCDKNEVLAGEEVKFSGKVSPPVSGTVTLKYLRGTTWVKICSVEVEEDGSFSFVWETPSTPGIYQVRAFFPETSDYFGSESEIVRIKILLPYPDLAVYSNDIIPLPNYPKTGDHVEFMVTIRNEGMVTAERADLFITMLYYVRQGSKLVPKNVFQTVSVGGVAPGEARTIWLSPGGPDFKIPEEAVGDMSVEVQIIPSEGTFDPNSENNRAKVDFPLKVELPDLVVTSFYPLFCQRDGETLVLKALITNSGDAPLEGEVQVSFLMEGRTIGTATLSFHGSGVPESQTAYLVISPKEKEEILPGLQPSFPSGSASFAKLSIPGPGTKIEAVVDPNNLVFEESEENNVFSYVCSAIKDCNMPDLFISGDEVGISLHRAGSGRIGVSISGYVHNIGFAPSGEYSVEIRAGDLVEKFPMPSLGRDETGIFSRSLSLPIDGFNGEITIIVDPEGSVKELDEENNMVVLRAPLSFGADFTIELGEISSGTLTPGSTAMIRFIVRNVGDPIDPSLWDGLYVEFHTSLGQNYHLLLLPETYLLQDGLQVWEGYIEVELPPGADAIVDGIEITASVNLDEKYAVPEVNTENNIDTRFYPLSVLYYDLELSSVTCDEIIEGDGFNIYYEIKNAGTSSITEETLITLKVDMGGLHVDVQVPAGVMTPGSTYEGIYQVKSEDWDQILSTGTPSELRLEISTDLDEVFTENNVYVLSLDLAPDLAIEFEEEVEAITGVEFTVHLVVSNLGNIESSPTKIKVWIEDEEGYLVKSTEVDFDSLEPYSSEYVDVDFSPTPYSGPITAYAKIFQVENENNIDNNCCSISGVVIGNNPPILEGISRHRTEEGVGVDAPSLVGLSLFEGTVPFLLEGEGDILIFKIYDPDEGDYVDWIKLEGTVGDSYNSITKTTYGYNPSYVPFWPKSELGITEEGVYQVTVTLCDSRGLESEFTVTLIALEIPELEVVSVDVEQPKDLWSEQADDRMVKVQITVQNPSSIDSSVYARWKYLPYDLLTHLPEDYGDPSEFKELGTVPAGGTGVFEALIPASIFDWESLTWYPDYSSIVAGTFQFGYLEIACGNPSSEFEALRLLQEQQIEIDVLHCTRFYAYVTGLLGDENGNGVLEGGEKHNLSVQLCYASHYGISEIVGVEWWEVAPPIRQKAKKATNFNQLMGSGPYSGFYSVELSFGFWGQTVNYEGNYYVVPVVRWRDSNGVEHSSISYSPKSGSIEVVPLQTLFRVTQEEVSGMRKYREVRLGITYLGTSPKTVVFKADYDSPNVAFYQNQVFLSTRTHTFQSQYEICPLRIAFDFVGSWPEKINLYVMEVNQEDSSTTYSPLMVIEVEVPYARCQHSSGYRGCAHGWRFSNWGEGYCSGMCMTSLELYRDGKKAINYNKNDPYPIPDPSYLATHWGQSPTCGEEIMHKHWWFSTYFLARHLTILEWLSIINTLYYGVKRVTFFYSGLQEGHSIVVSSCVHPDGTDTYYFYGYDPNTPLYDPDGPSRGYSSDFLDGVVTPVLWTQGFEFQTASGTVYIVDIGFP